MPQYYSTVCLRSLTFFERRRNCNASPRQAGIWTNWPEINESKHFRAPHWIDKRNPAQGVSKGSSFHCERLRIACCLIARARTGPSSVTNALPILRWGPWGSLIRDKRLLDKNRELEMSGAGGPRIRASAARAHTRKTVPKARCSSSLGLVLLSSIFALLAWVTYRSIQPPPPAICGTANGPPVTAPRIELSDGRYLAYKEFGVPRKEAKYKIVAVHGYGGSRHALLGGLTDDVIDELSIYIVGYDRAGYGQSTPNPGRTVKSEAFDVQELADALELGPTFYVAATSIGGYTGYALLKYLPHRLAGLTMFAPVTNFWWPGIPKEDAKKAWKTQYIGDRMALAVAHHAPWLLYWYMTQTWLPTSSTVKMERSRLAEYDRNIISKHYGKVHAKNPLEPTQQGRAESQHQDMKVVFGKWEFDPGTLENPFVNSSARVDIWQGDNDYLVPVILQRYIARSLPWVHYHELPGEGHALVGVPGLADIMVKTMLIGP